MSDFLQIQTSEAAAEAAPPPLVPDSVRQRLQAVYDKVPGVSCECDRLGQCCELTPEEMAADFAAMYPLYPIEYLNIVDHVNAHFDADRREALANVFDERPQRCPFLSTGGRCSIHPVRPLVCRTYGVVSRGMVEETARNARDQVPAHWLQDYLFTERQTVCPHTRPLNPEAAGAHASRMVRFEYDRELVALGREVDGLAPDRRRDFSELTGRPHITRWSWGGFNALFRSPASWFSEHFSAYWMQCFLGE